MPRKPRMYWQRGAAMEVRAEKRPLHQPFGSEAATCAYYWNLHALALHLPRHFGGHVSDEDITATVRHVVETEELPWAVHIPEGW